MPSVVVALSAILVATALLHLALSAFLARHLRRLSRPAPPLQTAPRAAVVLAVRGSDPFLPQAIRALADQDYSDYEVRIVVDHVEDPAWDVVHQAIDGIEHCTVRVESLRDRPSTCSLKCSALIQAIAGLPPDFKILALADADVVPHRTWLSELAGPLQDERVGISTGNQWFVPERGNLGSWARSVWNAGAVVPTILLGHPWAGSCAMRLDDVHRSGLLDRWRTSIVDDGPIGPALKSLGRQVRFVPSVLMINRERCRLRFCAAYIRRMLTWSRLYEVTFPLTVLHSIMLGLVNLLPMVVAVIAVWQGLWAWAGLMVATLMLFWLGNGLAYRAIAKAVRRHTQSQRDRWPAHRWVDGILLVAAVPVTHLMYASSSVVAWFVRRVRWREITYEINRRGRVTMVGYRPYRAPASKGRRAKKAELSI